jgi:Spy/CpxP family protein refolding chaperone
MKFTFKPLSTLNTLVLAGLLTAAGGVAVAQTAATTPAPATAAMGMGMAGGHHGDRMGHRDPAKMQAMMAKHQADMKVRLKITPAQEGAWTAFTTAMQPPAGMMGKRADAGLRAEMDKLTTPERIDKMRAMRTQRMAERTTLMDQRGAATKTFYAALNAEQQKTFDAEHQKHGMGEGRGRHGGGMHHKG